MLKNLCRLTKHDDFQVFVLAELERFELYLDLLAAFDHLVLGDELGFAPIKQLGFIGGGLVFAEFEAQPGCRLRRGPRRGRGRAFGHLGFRCFLNQGILTLDAKRLKKSKFG